MNDLKLLAEMEVSAIRRSADREHGRIVEGSGSSEPEALRNPVSLGQ